MHNFIFLCGVHRSGTTALNTLLGSDPRVSVFHDTGVTEDEGQYLQSIFPVEKEYGGVGEFALNKQCHWTESSQYVQPAKRELFNLWSEYWDLDKPVLVEKTPANIVRTRFLREVFPGASFIVMMRHPVAVVLAATKWRTQLPLETMLKNWFAAYDIFWADIKQLDNINYAILKYEDFVQNPAMYKEDIDRVLGFESELNMKLIKPGINTGYYNKWMNGDFRLWDSNQHWKNWIKAKCNRHLVKRLERTYESRLADYGYSFSDVYDGKLAAS